METTLSKTIGTREEVYKCIASHTSGGLYKSDIIEKLHNGKTIYVSKKISDKMKEQINIIREYNPNFLKKQKKTFSVPKKYKNNSKTQKISFKNQNEVKNIYYPELKGINLNELKEDLLREEAEEDAAYIEELDKLEELTNNNKVKKKLLDPFKIDKIEDIDDIDINYL